MPKTHTLQRRPAPAARRESANPLAAPREFAEPALQTPTAGLGHDFARVAVRRNDTGLDDRLKAGIERLSGVSLDDVRVHYRSAQPARVQAAAFTQGTHIHVAPGQEHHLAHEAWHVVQQKQGRVRATGRVAGRPLNDAEHLEREASVMGEKALAAGSSSSAEPASAAPVRQDAGAGAAATSAPVQAWPEWLDNWLAERRRKNNPRAHYDSLSDNDRYAANVQDRIADREREDDLAHQRWARSFALPDVQSTAASHGIETAQSAASKASGIIGKGAEGLALSHIATGAATGVGAGATGLGVASSLLSAASGVRNLATDETRAKDKALTTGGVLSDLGSATTTASSGLTQASKLGWGFADKAAPVLSKVAGPVAMARGGLDIVRGSAQAGLALHRRGKLKEIEEGGRTYAGVARFAKQTQTTRAVSGVGTAIGGGLALAGGLGIAGLALSNPVGWGLLAGAAGVGAGIAAYKKYRKHQIGKQLDTKAYKDQLDSAGIHVPSDDELKPTTTWGKIKNVLTLSSSSQRRYEAVRGHIAQKLAKNEDVGAQNWSLDVSPILKNLGVKRKPYVPPSESTPLTERDEARKKRAKNIARALDA